MSHALLAPSSAYQWRWCAGSLTLSQGIGDEDTEASREGTASHWVGEQIIRSMTNTDLSVLIDEDFIDKAAPNGMIVDEEMYDCALTYARDILQVCNQRGLSRQLHIEQRVTMPEIHEQCWGTPDCWAFDDKQSTLYLWDYKYGHGSVQAFENWQMICYAIGALREVTNNNPLGDHNIKVKIRITQPRCYDGLGTFRDWEITNSDLRGYVNQLSQAAELAMSGTGQCVTGEHCKNCDGRALCPALTDAVACIVDRSTDIIPVLPSPEGLAYELEVINRASALLKARQSALEEEAMHRLRNNEKVPGWSLEQGYGRNTWLHGEADVVSLGAMMGVDLLAKPVLLTPAKATALLKKNNVDASVISSYYGKKPTAMKLVVDDGSKAKQIFSNGSI